MPQYDKYGKLKRMSFKYNGKTITLAVNPQNYEFQEQQRATIMKTQSDNVIEQYGPDFPIISISGNTGYRKVNGKTGKQRFDELRAFFLGYQARQVDGAAEAGDMYFYNWTDDLSYRVTIPSGGFQYSRNVDTTLLFNYSISLLVLGGSDQPDRSNVVNPIVGTGTGSSVTKGTSVSKQRSTDDGATKVIQSITKQKTTIASAIAPAKTVQAAGNKKKTTTTKVSGLTIKSAVGSGIAGAMGWMKGETNG